MTDGQPRQGRPSGDWSQPHEETGGWPPPGPAQPRYGGGPGTTGGRDPYRDAHRRTGPEGSGQDGTAPWAAGDSRYGRLPGGQWGGPPPQQPRRPPPRRRAGNPVTLALIAINVVVYLLQTADPAITYRYGLLPVAVESGQYERLLTAAFLHAGFLHLGSNMLALFIVGAPLERAIGSARFSTIYLTSALGGSLLALALAPPTTLGVGASGAVFGVFGALAVLRNRIGADVRSIAVLIGINLVISFAVPGISWQAHVGGLVTGAIVAAVVAGRRPRARPPG
ncbi:MAG TPA: rhomboid family intramembrane serine protease [Mycobacteriales bacterium]|nr:rhomboid family intramembrane serine protease [Mycobacteriales bacterium]